ncbi:MAG: histidine phosphatase family protein [Rhodoferax sp.]|jgi:broad specificity phosphatase PhoE|nr:histidine phosphatase family protein [Rhodoferax sp.]MBP9930079.1 histidine phosphatase family protein [Rhodoferax sp.]HQX60059.1 histidine phosphatase family protein [Burkholderiaceae bacterium]HQZ07258.1 histidine phosphatase family protein [Burkholderiaceae bacterium]
MQRDLIFITHPDVLIDPAVPVPQWPLSERGLARMRASLQQAWVDEISAVVCSTEQKARDGAAVLAGHRGLPVTAIAALGENDRSATGFLAPAEFERTADAFFAQPEQSVRGWERAIDAQRRVVRAVQALADADTTRGLLAIVSHGAVGTLLYCHLAGVPIARQWDQPPNRGGNFYRFTLAPAGVAHGWRPIDILPVAADTPVTHGLHRITH